MYPGGDPCPFCLSNSTSMRFTSFSRRAIQSANSRSCTWCPPLPRLSSHSGIGCGSEVSKEGFDPSDRLWPFKINGSVVNTLAPSESKTIGIGVRLKRYNCRCRRHHHSERNNINASSTITPATTTPITLAFLDPEVILLELNAALDPMSVLIDSRTEDTLKVGVPLELLVTK